MSRPGGAATSGPGGPEGTPRGTPQRILDAALTSFAARGYEATSLDALAVVLGVRKQTILYWYPSKEALLFALVERSAAELGDAMRAGLGVDGDAWTQVDAVVRAVFALAGRRPELLGFAREVSRLGSPYVDALVGALEPLAADAIAFLGSAMARGELRAHDPRALLLDAYSSVIGAATEIEVRTSLGLGGAARVWVRRRRELLDRLRDVMGDGSVAGT